MGCDVILTSNSFDDDDLKEELSSSLWGYPHLVDIVFSEYADVRRRNIEQRRTRRNDREAAPAEPEKEVPPPPLSEPFAELWAHARAEDVNPQYMTQGPGWYAFFNPGLERSLDVSLFHTLTHGRCESLMSSTAWIIDTLFHHMI